MPNPPIQIAIVGAGQIGSALAFQLVRTGNHTVTLVGRPNSPRLQQLQQNPAIVTTTGEHAPISITDTLDEAHPYNLIIVTLLAHQTKAVLPNLQRTAAACILFMGNTFHPETLQAAIGPNRCAFGMPFLQAMLNQEGRLKITIGTGGQKTLLDQQRWVTLFNTAGVLAKLEPNMQPWLRSHVPLCVAFESVAATATKRGAGASWAESTVLAKGMRESFKLIQSLGHAIYPTTKKRLATLPTFAPAAMLWSLSRIRSFRELLATGKPECIALIDDMLAAAPNANPPVKTRLIEAMKPQ